MEDQLTWPKKTPKPLVPLPIQPPPPLQVFPLHLPNGLGSKSAERERWILAHSLSIPPPTPYLFSQLPLSNPVDSKTNVSSSNPHSQQTFLLPTTTTTKCHRFTTTASEFSNGIVSVTPWHHLPALLWAAKPRKYLFDHPLLSLRSQFSFNIALFDSFSLCCFLC